MATSSFLSIDSFPSPSLQEARPESRSPQVLVVVAVLEEAVAVELHEVVVALATAAVEEDRAVASLVAVVVVVDFQEVAAEVSLEAVAAEAASLEVVVGVTELSRTVLGCFARWHESTHLFVCGISLDVYTTYRYHDSPSTAFRSLDGFTVKMIRYMAPLWAFPDG